MALTKLSCALFVLLLPVALPAGAQQSLPAIAPPGPSSTSQQIHLDVVVDSKSGQPVNYLAQQDFTVLDNKAPLPITSFKVVTSAQEPVEVIVLIDGVNTPYVTSAYAREQTEKFLKENEGTLAHPTSIALLSDDGVQIDNGFSINGNILSDSLEHHQIGLREINRSSQRGDSERWDICVKALHQVVDYAATLPGRKLILYISPGWPLLSGPHIDISASRQQQVFNDIVYLSSKMRQSKIVLYNVSPIGATESLMAANYYEEFLKGISKISQTQYGDLGLQVLAVQSGGLSIASNSDVTGMIQKCLADANSWYEIAFDPPPPDKPNEYHHIEVRLDQPGLVARTRTGYYSNPVATGSGR
jgi:VWFA-related protein